MTRTKVKRTWLWCCFGSIKPAKQGLEQQKQDYIGLPTKTLQRKNLWELLVFCLLVIWLWLQCPICLWQWDVHKLQWILANTQYYAEQGNSNHKMSQTCCGDMWNDSKPKVLRACCPRAESGARENIYSDNQSNLANKLQTNGATPHLRACWCLLFLPLDQLALTLTLTPFLPATKLRLLEAKGPIRTRRARLSYSTCSAT